MVANREMFKSELYRVDRDLSATRHELSISIAALPTRDAIEAMLVSKVAPLESDLRALVIELARNGMHPPKGGNRYDDAP